MIIGIDISSIPYGTGVSNYTLNLVKNLLDWDKQNTYKLFFTSLRLKIPQEIIELKKLPNVRIFHYHLPLSVLEFVWNKLRLLPIEAFIGRCDIFHTSDWTQPPAIRAKLITTVHDLTPFLFPKWHHPKVVSVHHRKMYLASRHCHHFICVSQNTKNDLLRLYSNIKPIDTTVVYEAAEDKYQQFSKLPDNSKNDQIRRIKIDYGITKYFLAQGTREPRKNLSRLIDAFLMFKKKHPKDTTQLVISGKYGWGNDVRKPHQDIKLLGYVPEKDMVPLHAGAFCLVYPSLYEGFGLPLIKSFAVGIPVITSNNSSMAEIAKDNAILVDPYSIDSIFQGLETVFKDSSKRDELSKKGLKIVKKYSWLKTAQATLKVYQKLC